MDGPLVSRYVILLAKCSFFVECFRVHSSRFGKALAAKFAETVFGV